MLKKYAFSALVSLSLVACDNPASHTSASKHTKQLSETKSAVIKTVTGEYIDLGHLKRDWIYINYWANWCQPCKKEIPELNEFARHHQNIYMVGVNYDGVDSGKLLELISKNKIEYFNAMTDPSEDLKIGDIPGLPVTFVFNQKGELVKKLFGPQTQESLAQAVF